VFPVEENWLVWVREAPASNISIVFLNVIIFVVEGRKIISTNIICYNTRMVKYVRSGSRPEVDISITLGNC